MAELIVSYFVGLLMFGLAYPACYFALYGVFSLDDHQNECGVVVAIGLGWACLHYIVEGAAIFGGLTSIVSGAVLVFYITKKEDKDFQKMQEKIWFASENFLSEARNGKSINQLIELSPDLFRENSRLIPGVLDSYKQTLGKSFVGILADGETTLISDQESPIIILSPDELISAEIIEDEEVVASIRKDGSIGRAVVGGALAGGFGAVVGVASASSTIRNETKVSKLALRIITSNFKYPSLEIIFISGSGGYSRTGKEYLSYLRECQKWHGRFVNMIKKSAASVGGGPKKVSPTVAELEHIPGDVPPKKKARRRRPQGGDDVIQSGTSMD